MEDPRESLEPVEDVTLSPSMPASQLVEALGRIHGFMAGHVYAAVEILSEAIRESRLRVLTFTANIVSTGLRGILAQMIRDGWFNVVITTTGTLDHDIARAMGGRYLKGFFDASDEWLHEVGVHRLGNVFIPVEDYGPLVEKFVRRLLPAALERGEEWGISELLELAGEMIDDPNSILRAAYENKVPVFVPGWPDGAFGTALFTESQRLGRRFVIDYFRDMKRLADIFFPRDGKAMGLLIGGGISKHHAIWWSQFRGGLDYAVYITTAPEYDGSLSGARPREAISWGKLKPSAKKTVVYGDATVLLPLIVVGVQARLSRQL